MGSFLETYNDPNVFNLARLRDIRQVPVEPRRPLSAIQLSNADSSSTTDGDETSGTPISSQGEY